MPLAVCHRDGATESFIMSSGFLTKSKHLRLVQIQHSVASDPAQALTFNNLAGIIETSNHY